MEDDKDSDSDSDYCSDAAVQFTSGGLRRQNEAQNPAEMEQSVYDDECNEPEVYIGPLTVSQRYNKIKTYLEKKYNRVFGQKYTYISR